MHLQSIARDVVLVSAAALLSACATTPGGYPDAARNSVSVSTRVEFPGAAYLANNGQVAVAGKTAGQNVGAAFGALGVGFGSVVDFHRNRASLEGREAVVDMRFDALVAERLKAEGLNVSPPDDRNAPVLVMPSVLLYTADAAKGTSLSCTLAVQYGERDRRGALQTQRRYTYSRPGLAPLVGQGNGWTDDGGRLLQETSRKCFGWLTGAMAADWRGRFRPGPRVRAYNSFTGSTLEGSVLFDGGEYVVVASGPDEAAAAPRTNVMVLEAADVIR